MTTLKQQIPLLSFSTEKGDNLRSKLPKCDSYNIIITFFLFPLHLMPVLGGLCQNTTIKLVTEKLKWCRQKTVKKV